MKPCVIHRCWALLLLLLLRLAGRLQSDFQTNHLVPIHRVRIDIRLVFRLA